MNIVLLQSTSRWTIPIHFRAKLFEVVPAAGVEPATFRSGGERSNPLSYAGLNKMACFKEAPKKCTSFLPLFVHLVNNGALSCYCKSSCTNLD